MTHASFFSYSDLGFCSVCVMKSAIALFEAFSFMKGSGWEWTWGKWKEKWESGRSRGRGKLWLEYTVGGKNLFSIKTKKGVIVNQEFLWLKSVPRYYLYFSLIQKMLQLWLKKCTRSQSKSQAQSFMAEVNKEIWVIKWSYAQLIYSILLL